MQGLMDRHDLVATLDRQRQLAVAADAELRRRHPGQHHPPLRSYEPAPSAADDISQTGQLVAELTAQRREFARQFSERKPQPLPAANSAGFRPAFPARTGQGRDAIQASWPRTCT